MTPLHQLIRDCILYVGIVLSTFGLGMAENFGKDERARKLGVCQEPADLTLKNIEADLERLYYRTGGTNTAKVTAELLRSRALQGLGGDCSTVASEFEVNNRPVVRNHEISFSEWEFVGLRREDAVR